MNRAHDFAQRLSWFPGSDCPASFFCFMMPPSCRLSAMSRRSSTLHKICGALLIQFQVVSITLEKSQHALLWQFQDRNWFLSEMTVVILKQRKKNPVLLSRTVIVLTPSNEYLISKQNPCIHFIFQGAEIWRGSFSWIGLLFILCWRILMTAK